MTCRCRVERNSRIAVALCIRHGRRRRRQQCQQNKRPQTRHCQQETGFEGFRRKRTTRSIMIVMIIHHCWSVTWRGYKVIDKERLREGCRLWWLLAGQRHGFADNDYGTVRLRKWQTSRWLFYRTTESNDSEYGEPNQTYSSFTVRPTSDRWLTKCIIFRLCTKV